MKTQGLTLPAHCFCYLILQSQGLALSSQCALPTSLPVWSRLHHPPTHPASGSHIFITIKESPACPAIRAHYSASHGLTLVTLSSVIWLALAQDFLAGGLPRVSWGERAHIYNTARLHLGALRGFACTGGGCFWWHIHCVWDQSQHIRLAPSSGKASGVSTGGYRIVCNWIDE